MVHFGLPWDMMVHVKAKNTVLSNTGPVSVHDLPGSYVELNQPAAQQNLKKLITDAHDEHG